jgi:hypothetical protein
MAFVKGIIIPEIDYKYVKEEVKTISKN